MGRKKLKVASNANQVEQVRRVAFGGSLIRDFGSLPGLLDRFVHVTQSFGSEQFNGLVPMIEACFGKTNADEVQTDERINFPAGALFCLGAEGHSAAGKTVLIFKFIPLSAMYPPHDFRSIFAVGENLEVI